MALRQSDSDYTRWKDMKMRMCIIGAIIAIILIAIIVPCKLLQPVL